MRSRRLPREVRERQILDAAVRVFSASGYHDTSMDEISEVAGISKPMIYAYLGSKEDLFTACLRRESARLVEAILADVVPGLPADVQLWRGLRSFFDFVDKHRDGWRVLHRRAGAQGATFVAELQGTRSRAIELIAALLVSAASTAEAAEVGVTARHSSEALAAALVGAGEALADWWLEHPQDSADTLAVRLMNLVWMGFGDLMLDKVWKPPAD